MSEKGKCPNCGQVHGVEDACFVGMLLGVVRDRETVELTDEVIEAVLSEVDTDWLWTRWGGPAADYIESLAVEATKEGAEARIIPSADVLKRLAEDEAEGGE